GSSSKIEGLIQVVTESGYTILEVSRTGRMAMRRGHHTSRVLSALGSNQTQMATEAATAVSWTLMATWGTRSCPTNLKTCTRKRRSLFRSFPFHRNTNRSSCTLTGPASPE
ncbi:MAG TPA: hypothetical protein VE109_00300, partial [Acidobacteriaceae bacterium]|nr:hypothetical protein [Acidobacteriaceae bacterium]